MTKHSFPATHIQLKRAYEPASSEDGVRILVDRLWPRGVSKSKAALDDWMKDIAPSTELRKWFFKTTSLNSTTSVIWLAQERSRSSTVPMTKRITMRSCCETCSCMERGIDEMTRRFKIGDHVTWNSEAGRVSGTIVAIHTSNFDYKGYTHHATKDDPQYEIKSDRTDHIAAHKGGALDYA